MSTRVTPEEYGTLTEVPEFMHYRGRKLCDIQPSHGVVTKMLQTPDHRAIEVCGGCYVEIQREIRKRNEL